MFEFDSFRKIVRGRDARRVVLRTLEAIVSPPGPKQANDLARFVFEPNEQESSRRRRPFFTAQSNLLIDLEERGLVTRDSEKAKTFWNISSDGVTLLMQHKPEFAYLTSPTEGALEKK